MRRFPLGSSSVSRVGFGAMQLAGPGVFGPPRDHDQAVAVVRRAVELGVDHIDTSQYYGPDVVNELIREALHPYPDALAIVSKVGARRDSAGGWLPHDEPDQLREGIEDNLRTLGVERLAAVNLRLLEGKAPDQRFDDQLDAMIKARDDGLIGGIGLSNVTLEHLLHAVGRTEIACVQNPFNLARPGVDADPGRVHRRGIAFVPFFPLGSGFSADNPVLGNEHVRAIAAELDRTPAQVVLAWTLSMAPNVLLIPGTSSVGHLRGEPRRRRHRAHPTSNSACPHPPPIRPDAAVGWSGGQHADLRCRQHLLDAQHRGPGQPGVLAQHAVGQHQVAGGQRQRPLVDDAAHAGQQLVAGRGERAADGHPGRVVEVHEHRHQLADVRRRLADQAQRGRVGLGQQGAQLGDA